jgi:hypothetical protein
MDRLREGAELSQLPHVGKWEVVGTDWQFDGGFCSSRVRPVKLIHYPKQSWFQVSFSETARYKFEVVGLYETFEIAQDVAESLVASCLRGVTVTPEEIATKRIG